MVFVRPVCDVLSCMGRFFCREGKFLMSLLIKELYEKQNRLYLMVNKTLFR